MRHFPIGVDDFAMLVQKEIPSGYEHHFADKTLFIRDILNSGDVATLITKPRRFGKTLNLSMLQYFFDIQQAAEHRALFDGLKITRETVSLGANVERSCLDYQGQFPTLFITFKSCVLEGYDECYKQIKRVLQRLYGQHRYLLESDKLAPEEKNIFQKILDGSADNSFYNNALLYLCQYLYQHHHKKVIVLIDEYDAPFQMALHRGFYDPLQAVMRVLIGEVLKGNPYLKKAVLTGILRIAGAGIFSGANNVATYTVLDDKYSEYFGFTEEDIHKLLEDIAGEGHPEAFQSLDEIRRRYNGYQFGHTIIYNPWSTMRYFSMGFQYGMYWVNTSDDKLLKDMLLNASSVIQEKMGTLVADKPTEITVHAELRFDETLSLEEHLWNLLLSAGYLKAIETRLAEARMRCTVLIPNREVKTAYLGIFTDWLQTKMEVRERETLIECLLTGNAEQFCARLSNFYMRTVSNFDVASDKIEAFYHGFMIGLIGLCQYDHNAYLHSNRESGLGRYDLVIEPKNTKHPRYNAGIILEFKRTLNEGELQLAARGAVNQIKALQYDTDLRTRGVENIVVIGVAFCGKILESAYEVRSKLENAAALAHIGVFGATAAQPHPVGPPQLTYEGEDAQGSSKRPRES